MSLVEYLAVDHTLLLWIQQTPLSIAIRHSDWAVMGLESVHLLGLALLGGSVTLIALAALGGLRGLSVPMLARGLMPLLTTGLVLMVISGALIAQSMPYRYYLNSAFRIKMLLLVAAIATTRWLSRTVTGTSRSVVAHRMLALLSFLLWLGVGVSGRLIGFL